MKQLLDLFDALDEQPFLKLIKLKGNYRLRQFDLTFLHLQNSPGAHPASIGELLFDPEQVGFPSSFMASPEAGFALSDFLIRRFNDGIKRYASPNRGAEGSGSFHTIGLGQTMLHTDSVIVSKRHVQLRFIVSFPSRSRGGGSFDADQAKIMFQQELADITRYSLCYSNYPVQTKQALDDHLRIVEDRKAILAFLSDNGCITFIPDGAILARKSGVDDRPLDSGAIKRFYSPDSLAVEIPLKERRSIRGMTVKEGITVITGGGSHGKSTLLKAIASGIYPHIPGDGRELIVTRPDAVTVQAEEGRSVEKVTITPFIRELPGGISTDPFSTDNASGSTSQAAGIIEAFEAGSRLLMLDEDTSATNFLVRDSLIEKIIPADQEPIIPLYNRVRSLWENHGISWLMVTGGLGIFLKKADTILSMNNFVCNDVTSSVRKILGPMETDKTTDFQLPGPRLLDEGNFDPSYTNRRLNKTLTCRIKPLRNDPKKLEYGMDLIDLSAAFAIVEESQTMTIGCLIHELAGCLSKLKTTDEESLTELIDKLYCRIDVRGLFDLDHNYPGTLSLARKFELAAVNRMRSLRIKDKNKHMVYGKSLDT